MRPGLVLIILTFGVMPAVAGSHAMHGEKPFPLPPIDFSHTGSFNAFGAGDENIGLMLRKPLLGPPQEERNLLPSLHVGPFHATLGGINTGVSNPAEDRLDPRDFWKSSIAASASGHGAKLTFTLPTH
ncbi:MAG TPA: hypothetical protein VII49_05420 [Rhizomicrobium sp.]